MPYDFTKQKELLDAALVLLDTKGISQFAFGGGTALSAFYLNHRYSTDIDIFLYPDGSTNRLRTLKSDWNKPIHDAFASVGYEGICCAPGHYLEFTIDDQSKIQFFDNNSFTQTPYVSGSLWDHQINIESQEEILAKKIFYRGNKGNARDIYDIAVAFRTTPELICKLQESKRLDQSKWGDFYTTLSHICSLNERYDAYSIDINTMSPASQFSHIADFAPHYLKIITETIVHLNGEQLSPSDALEISDIAYQDAPIEYYATRASSKTLKEATVEVMAGDNDPYLK